MRPVRRQRGTVRHVFVVLVLVVTAREERLAARCLPPFGIARARRKHGRSSVRCSCQVRRPVVWLSEKSFVFNKLLQRMCAVTNKTAGYEAMAVLMRYETFPGRTKKDWRRRMLSVQSRVERERSTKAADCDCLIITLSKTVSYFSYSTLFQRQVGRTAQVLLTLSAAVTGSLLGIQLT